MTDFGVIAKQLSLIYYTTPETRKEERKALMQAWEGIEHWLALTHKHVPEYMQDDGSSMDGTGRGRA